MTRKMIKLIALVCVVMLALTGCNLIRVDEEMDNAEIVAKFNGGTVTKGEIIDEYNYDVNYYAQLSSYYGITLSTDGLLENVVSEAAKAKILVNKAKELGVDSLTEEQIASIEEEATSQYESNVEEYWEQYAEEGLTDEEIRAAIEEYFTSLGYTKEEIIESEEQSAIIANLQEYVQKDVTVLPEDVQNEYNTRVENAQTTYADAYEFESAVSNDSVIYWYPEGYRTVKQILVMFTDEQRDTLSGLVQEIEDLATEIETVSALIENGNETAYIEGTDNAEMLESLKLQQAQCQTDYDNYVTAYTAELQTKIDEIMARIEAGEDFDALIAEYGEDSGMKSEPAMTEGYYVSANSEMWLQEFTENSMALANVGDVSAPFSSMYGVHIVRYNSNVISGAVAYDKVSADIEADLLEQAKSDAYDAQVEAWVEEANVEYDFSSVEE